MKNVPNPEKYKINRSVIAERKVPSTKKRIEYSQKYLILVKMLSVIILWCLRRYHETLRVASVISTQQLHKNADVFTQICYFQNALQYTISTIPLRQASRR